MKDVIEITQDLIRYPSVTPDASEALDYCAEILHALGFACQRLPFGEGAETVDNLYATWGAAENRLLFCGHLDVVPPGNKGAWTHDPFSAVIEDGLLHGRGAVDMKGNIACYFAALAEVMPRLNPDSDGLALLLTGDEEGDAVHGVRAVVPELIRRGEAWVACVTGEPTSQQIVGDAYKRGRRGSLNGSVTISGVQGHTGYPARADNAAHRMVDVLYALRHMPLDTGNDDFEPSWLAITTVDVGNEAGNIIPGQASAHVNFRFNTEQTSAGLMQKTEAIIAEHVPDGKWEVFWRIPSEPYLSTSGKHSSILERTIKEIFAIDSRPTTVGGTSDSRFIHMHCPVIDFGLCGRGMHEIDEAVPITDLHKLSAIYARFLEKSFQ